MKKVLSVVLALIMCAALSAPAFAADFSLDDFISTIKDLLPDDFDLGSLGDFSLDDILEMIPEGDFDDVLGQIQGLIGGGDFDLGAITGNLDGIKDILGDYIDPSILEGLSADGILALISGLIGGLGGGDTTDPVTTPPNDDNDDDDDNGLGNGNEIENPKTGIATGMAAFAAMSIAAVGAYVSKKKED